jgi:glycosyltransferase involved in cell wall biosynthesis
MAHIVMICREYYPTFGPTGNCMNNIVQELKKDHKITVISCKTDWDMSSEHYYEGIRIERVNNFRNCFYEWYNKRKMKSSNRIRKVIDVFLYSVLRTLSIIETTFRFQSLQKTLIARYIVTLKDIQKKDNIDIIISVGQPYESSVAAYKFQKKFKNVRLFAFLFDHFTESATLNRFEFLKKLRYKFNLEIEQNIILKSEHTFILPQLKNHYNKFFLTYNNKYSLIEHPLLVEHQIKLEHQEINFSVGAINIVYTGMLDKTLRNPEYLLETLKFIPNNSICFNVFHTGNCYELLESYKDVLGEKLNNFGKVPLNVSFEAMNKADILLNFGVTYGDQVSGKIFDYISFGKPIIHLYFLDEDPNLIYFRNYPMALCLKMDKELIEENTNKLLEFCKKTVGKKLTFEEVKKLFYNATPKYVVDELLLHIEKNKRN